MGLFESNVTLQYRVTTTCVGLYEHRSHQKSRRFKFAIVSIRRNGPALLRIELSCHRTVKLIRNVAKTFNTHKSLSRNIAVPIKFMSGKYENCYLYKTVYYFILSILYLYNIDNIITIKYFSKRKETHKIYKSLTWPQ